jgi:hypothetical protein
LGRGISLPQLQAKLKEFDNTIVAQHILSYFLRTELGSVYGPSCTVGTTLKNTGEHRARCDKYILAYEAAVKLEQQGLAVITYTDESYVNTEHRRKYTWYIPGQRARQRSEWQHGRRQATDYPARHDQIRSDVYT